MHIGTKTAQSRSRRSADQGGALTKAEKVKVLAAMRPEETGALVRQPELRFLDRARFFPWEPKGK